MRLPLIAAGVALLTASGCVVHSHPGHTRTVYQSVEYRYGGAHPVPSAWGDGWCFLEYSHVHEYEPDYSAYSYRTGVYYYSRPMVVWYVGYHPVPSGGDCRVHGRHSHHYHPGSSYADYYAWDARDRGYSYRPDRHQAAPVYGRPPPGQQTGYSPPGHVANPPPGRGRDNNPPTYGGGTPPGHGSTPPGHGGVPPGQVNNPGHGGSPGYGGMPPGHSNNPGRGGATPPGQVNNPGRGGGHSPGNGGGAPPGHVENPSRGNGHVNPGHAGGPPGRGNSGGDEARGRGNDRSNDRGNGHVVPAGSPPPAARGKPPARGNPRDNGKADEGKDNGSANPNQGNRRPPPPGRGR